MKIFLFLLSSLFLTGLRGQEVQRPAVQETIEAFFEGFHQQDSTRMRQAVSDEIVLQTIAVDSTGNTKVRTSDFGAFLKSITSIPESTKFEEIIKSFSIQIDGHMANAWTPYEFRINDTFHHCGVNSFQLVRYGEEWKIVYLIDTRRIEDCK